MYHKSSVKLPGQGGGAGGAGEGWGIIILFQTYLRGGLNRDGRLIQFSKEDGINSP